MSDEVVNGKVNVKLIQEEMKEAYLDYSMSVIIGRALPDVRDGLKPVHRRILFSMNENGLTFNKPFKKSATVVGNVMAKLHPHGDMAIYDTLVRLSQDFSMRYPLITGQGNFGSIDGDSAAAMRYTESKLSKISDEMLKDIEKDTVDFIPTYDGSSKEPMILPAKLPNLLLNGSSGIAVGMATNIPPHNLKEVCDAICALIDNPEANLAGVVLGPDFPTGGIIVGKQGIINAYKNGRGKVIVRGKTHMEEKGKKNVLVIDEIPYMVNKSNLIIHIADLVKDKKINGISDIRDESDRKGMRIVIELKKDVNGEVVLNQLFKHSNLQTTFGVIMLAVIDNQPKVMTLRDIIGYYIEHRKNVIVRRTKFELLKAEDRCHILEGLIIALNDIDEVVKLIKGSKDASSAKNGLIEKYNLSEKQSQAILDMKLQKLTSLETDKIKEERDSLLKLISELKEILGSEKKVLDILKEEVLELKEKYGDERRTDLIDGEADIDSEEIIQEETVVVSLTESGYVKSIPVDEYKQQKRGGKGVIGAGMKEEDVISKMFVTSNHSTLLCFTNFGKVHWLKGYEIPIGSRYSKGKAFVNLLNLSEGEKVNTILPMNGNGKVFVVLLTKKGLIKKVPATLFSKPRKGGVIAIKLKEGDELISSHLTDGSEEVIIATSKGYAIRFNENTVRASGRTSMGVKAITLRSGDSVIGIEKAVEGLSLFTVSSLGMGKRTKIEDYRVTNRGGKGIINMKVKDGFVVGVKLVSDEDELVLMSSNGIVIRIPAQDVSVIGRNTSGVRVMRLGSGDKLKNITRVEEI